MSSSDAPSSEPERIDNQSINHLIVVCCHAIWLGGPTNGMNEAECAATKGKTITTFGEGESYMDLAHRLQPLRYPTHLKAETQATDSYQNLLFSILHFRRVTSHYPTHITIISHAFKKRRFMELHVPAVRYSWKRVTYVGIDPPEHVTPRQSLLRGEGARGYGLWAGDMYGVGPLLGQKRKDRGWDDTRGMFLVDKKIEHGALQAIILGMHLEEGVRGVLDWEGGLRGTKIFSGELPWDEDKLGWYEDKLGDGQHGHAKKWPAVNDADGDGQDVNAKKWPAVNDADRA